MASYPAMAITPVNALMQGRGELDRANFLRSSELERQLKSQGLVREKLKTQLGEDPDVVAGVGTFKAEQAARETALSAAQKAKAREMANLFRDVDNPQKYAAALQFAEANGIDIGPFRSMPYDQQMIDKVTSYADSSVEGFTLKPGEVRFRGSGAPIVGLKPKAEKDTALEAKVDAFMESYGVDRKTAVAAASGALTVTPDATGGINVFNKLTRESEYIPPGGRAAEPKAAPPSGAPKAITAMDAVEKGIGLLPWLKETFVSPTLGQVSSGFVDTKMTEARTALRLLREEIIDALGKSGRPPVVEQQRILESFPSLGPMSAPAAATAQLEQSAAQLQTILDDDAAYAANLSNPAKLRLEAAERARAITRVLGKIGAGGQGQSRKGTFQPEIQNLIDKYAPR